MSDKVSERGVFVIFGGTGDLSRRKLLPALARQFESGALDGCHVVGLSRDALPDDTFREIAREALAAAGRPRHVIERFLKHLHAHSIGRGSEDGYHSLAG